MPSRLPVTSSETFAKALVELAVGRFGGLDVAFNNAGTTGDMGATPDVSLLEWEDTIRTNLTSAFLGAKYQLPAMLDRKGGSLIFTSTFVGYTIGLPGMAAYAASKAGLIGLTQALATEFGSKGIRVNALLPGGIDTPMGRAFANTPDTLAFVQGLHALKRMALRERLRNLHSTSRPMYRASPPVRRFLLTVGFPSIEPEYALSICPWKI